MTVGVAVGWMVGLAEGEVGATELGASVVGEMLVGDTVVGEFVGVCSKQRPRRISKKVRGTRSRLTQLVAPDGWVTRLGVWTRPCTSPR